MFENFTSLASHDWKGRIIYQDYKYCFQPLNSWQLMEDGGWYYDIPYLQVDYENLEIVARGIVSQYIRYEQKKSLKELFADYYNGCFETFKNNRRNDIELMLKSEKEIEIAFVETMIDDEKWRIEYSEKGIEKFSDYFSDEERRILKQVEKGFMSYLQDRLKELKPKQKKAKGKTTTSHDYFICKHTIEKVSGIFSRLKKENYIDSDSQINNWILACGFSSNDPTPFKPIIWLAQLNELVYMIDMLFPSCRWRWKAAEHCFLIDGNPPDNGAMRTESSAPTISKEKNHKIDEVLNIN